MDSDLPFSAQHENILSWASKHDVLPSIEYEEDKQDVPLPSSLCQVRP